MSKATRKWVQSQNSRYAADPHRLLDKALPSKNTSPDERSLLDSLGPTDLNFALTPDVNRSISVSALVQAFETDSWVVRPITLPSGPLSQWGDLLMWDPLSSAQQSGFWVDPTRNTDPGARARYDIGMDVQAKLPPTRGASRIECYFRAVPCFNCSWATFPDALEDFSAYLARKGRPETLVISMRNTYVLAEVPLQVEMTEFSSPFEGDRDESATAAPPIVPNEPAFQPGVQNDDNATLLPAGEEQLSSTDICTAPQHVMSLQRNGDGFTSAPLQIGTAHLELTWGSLPSQSGPSRTTGSSESGWEDTPCTYTSAEPVEVGWQLHLTPRRRINAMPAPEVPALASQAWRGTLDPSTTRMLRYFAGRKSRRGAAISPRGRQGKDTGGEVGTAASVRNAEPR